ncbi:MAG: ATP-dependent Clp protease proteolytic subunit [Amoebophilaceae bacterium]|nr:ATP-dependent Clp protease proteolytic subunit [Amoebophilaceae bacterium]
MNYKSLVVLSAGFLPIFGGSLSQLEAAVPSKNQKIKPVKEAVNQEENLSTDINKDGNAKRQSELEAENALNRALLEKSLSTIMAEIERLRLEKERKRLHKEMDDEAARKEHNKAIQLLQMKKEKLVAEIELAQVMFNKQMEQSSIQIAQLDRKTQLERGKALLLVEQKNRLQAEVDTLQMMRNREKYLPKNPIYLKDPLRKKDNVLVLSDRCVELDGVITPWKADHIVSQIQYFNNKNSSDPIFLVITDSPGGYVSAGWNILQAMKHSKAPVYVVVKTYAASMAALIATLATKSYSYPNAWILHHQPTCFSFALNVRAKQEDYERLRKLWERLGGAVAKKMGISLKAFDKKLYEKSMKGDWIEYGDNAKKLKWVDVVIAGVDDSALAVFPDPADYTWEKYGKKYWNSTAAEEGSTLSKEAEEYARLNPHDFNYCYNPLKQAK